MTLRVRNRPPFARYVTPGAKRMRRVFIHDWSEGYLRRLWFWLTPAQMAALREYKRRHDEEGARQYIISNGKKG